MLDQHTFIGKNQHEIFSGKHTGRKKHHRYQPAQAQCHAENFIQRFDIAFSPILRSQNPEARGCGRQKHILDKLNLSCQRNGRHIVLIHSAEHKRICHRHQRQHQILQDDGHHQSPELPIKCFVIGSPLHSFSFSPSLIAKFSLYMAFSYFKRLLSMIW